MNRFSLLGILIILFTVLLVSCSSTKWVSDPYSGYPQSEYVCAIGHGKTAEEADISARRELASLFGMAVTSTVSRSLVETTVETNGNRQESYGDYFTSDTSIVVNTDNLYGVEIARRTVEKDGTFISLAVMQREVTAEYYLSRLESDRQSIEVKKSVISEFLGSFKAVETAVELVGDCNDFNTYVVMCNYLSGSELGFINLSEAKDLYRKACDSIVLEVEVYGDDSGAVKSSVSKVFTDTGFSVSNGSLNPTAKAVITIVWRETLGTGVASGFVFANYNADVSVVDLVDNTTVFVFSSSDKEGHQNYESAQARAISGLSKKLEEEFREELNSKYTYQENLK